MHNCAKSIKRSHCDALFGHIANQQAINDHALIETTCNISSFGICSVYEACKVVGVVLAMGKP